MQLVDFTVWIHALVDYSTTNQAKGLERDQQSLQRVNPNRSSNHTRIAMTSNNLRRSSRLHIYDSNGRDFLADTMGWSRAELEVWLTGATVRPHLQLWYQLCVSGPRRFNEGIKWINTGDGGYYYDKEGLEDDLMLMCLEVWLPAVDSKQCLSDADLARYQDEDAHTKYWSTQELWARTVWRIVQANRAKGQAFDKLAESHPVACFGFVVDVLCIAFHSLAFRGRESVYHRLICANSKVVEGAKQIQSQNGDVEGEVGSRGDSIDSRMESSEECIGDGSSEEGYQTSETSIYDESDEGTEMKMGGVYED